MNVQLNLNRDFEKATLYKGVAERFKKAQKNFESQKYASVSIREAVRMSKAKFLNK